MLQRRPVSGGGPLHQFIDEQAQFRSMAYREKLRTSHRRYRYRFEQGKHYRYGDGDSELEEKFTHDPLHENDRYEYRQDRHRCGNRSKGYLPRSDQRRVHTRFAVLLITRNIFQHHNSVIDNDPYDQRKAEHGKYVNSEAHKIKDKERAGNGKRYG